jgi:hypothetical protein
MARQMNRQAELQRLRAEVEEQLDRLDFRSESLGRRWRRWPSTLNAPSGS